jgi:ribonucleotide reductase alpha subunit
MGEFNLIYIAIDGDNIHQKFEKCLLENDEMNIIRTSAQITSTIDKIIDYLQHEGLKIVFSAGDCILCKCKAVDLINLCNYLDKIRNVNTVSVGVGDTLEKTDVVFKYAKSIGRNRIVIYTLSNKLEVFDLNTVAPHSSCSVKCLTPCLAE